MPARFVVALNAGRGAGQPRAALPGLDGRTLEPGVPEGWPWPAGEAVTVRGGGRGSNCLPAPRACCARADQPGRDGRWRPTADADPARGVLRRTAPRRRGARRALDRARRLLAAQPTAGHARADAEARAPAHASPGTGVVRPRTGRRSRPTGRSTRRAGPRQPRTTPIGRRSVPCPPVARSRSASGRRRATSPTPRCACWTLGYAPGPDPDARSSPATARRATTGSDWWQAVISTSKQPTVLTYRFIVSDGPTTR